MLRAHTVCVTSTSHVCARPAHSCDMAVESSFNYKRLQKTQKKIHIC